jgi:DNA-binding NtrC family response regulator
LSSNKLHILALSADPTIRQSLEVFATRPDWRVEVYEDASSIFSALEFQSSILLIDESATESGYLSTVRRARRTAPGIDAVVVGGPKADDVRRQERDEGVDEYHERPLDMDIFRASLEHRRLLSEVKMDAGMIGRSDAVIEILEAVIQVAPTEVPILVEGESGTGKDVVARAVHRASRRRDQPFEAINCGALAEGVLESELFGHEKGAFTGAVSRRAGLFERASGGTVFLDEVGETSPNMQVRLLRVLETGEVLRVGGVANIQTDVRVIAATNRNLADAVHSGVFRQDLYYRLKGVNLHLAPLRSRGHDVALLATHFMILSNQKHRKSIRSIDAGAIRYLEDHHWPGNIRELRNVIDTIVVLAPGHKITAELVKSQLTDSRDLGEGGAPSPLLPVPLGRSKDEAEREMIYASLLTLHRDVQEILSLMRQGPAAAPWDGLKEVRTDPGSRDIPVPSLTQLERSAIQDALNRFAGNRRRAADSLGISERTLYRKIKEYGLI